MYLFLLTLSWKLLLLYNACSSMSGVSSTSFFSLPSPGSGAFAATRLWNRRLLWGRRGLIPIQRVRPEEGIEEDESQRAELKQDKTGAAGLETSWPEDARLFSGSQALGTAGRPGLCFGSFLWCFFFLLPNPENHLDHLGATGAFFFSFFCHKKIQDIW